MSALHQLIKSIGHSIPIRFSELWYKVISIGTQSCHFYENLAVPHRATVTQTHRDKKEEGKKVEVMIAKDCRISSCRKTDRQDWSCLQQKNIDRNQVRETENKNPAVVA